MTRDDLVRWLDDYLEIERYPDASMNGLQVEGHDEVVKVAVAVDASLSAYEAAADAGADLLIVHHGLFWGAPKAITGMHRRRVAYLLEHDISLYACHIPLDAHQEVGNNWGLARALGLEDLASFARYKGMPVGAKGRFPEPLSLRDLADRIERTLGESVLVHAAGAPEVATLGVVTGDASWNVVDAEREGLDAFLTGEPRQETFHEVFERGVNALYAGHYMTETVGVKLLAEKLEREFGLSTDFLLLPTGL